MHVHGQPQLDKHAQRVHTPAAAAAAPATTAAVGERADAARRRLAHRRPPLRHQQAREANAAQHRASVHSAALADPAAAAGQRAHDHDRARELARHVLQRSLHARGNKAKRSFFMLKAEFESNQFSSRHIYI